MENISYIGLSQQMALKEQMDITANNMANMNTPGFKAQSMMFLEYLNKPKGEGDTVRQVLDYASYRDLSGGALIQTHNDLDFAIQGDGYFVVETPEGPRYTRTGSFSLNEKREIVNKSGYRLLNESNNPIVVQADATHITLTPEGTLTSDKGEIGRVQIVDFENPQEMTEIGENLYDAVNLAKKTVENPQLSQGMLEGSNVNAIVEMNRMVEILRMYQSVQRMLQNDHDRIRGAIQKLTKV